MEAVAALIRYRIAFIILFGILCAVIGAEGFRLVSARIERKSIVPTAQPMNASITLARKHACSGVSPEIVVRKIPATATQIEVKLTDLNLLFEHGGGIVSVPSNGVIPEGALTQYFGPCPDEGEHTYRFRVNAFNEQSKIIGITELTLPCCSQLPD